MLIWSIIEIFLFPLSAWNVVVVQSLISADSVQTHGLQNSRLLCLSLLSHAVCSNSCSLSCWFYPTISSSLNLSSCCPNFFPASWSFPVSRLFASGGQSIGASASNEYSGLISFTFDCFDLLAVQGLPRVFLSTTVWKHQFFAFSLLYAPTLTSLHDHWKNQSFDCTDLYWQSGVSAF